MSDIFEEAEEGLRRDRWVAIAKKSAPWVGGILGGALVLALGYWGYTAWQDQAMNKSSEAYNAALEIAETGDLEKAKAEYQKVVDTGSEGYKALALMQLAGIALEEGKSAEAQKYFDDAAKTSSAPLVSDQAALKAAFVAMDTGSFEDVKARLEPLAKEGRPYAAMAREALAMAKVQHGDLKGAKTDLQLLSVSLDAPEGVKQRAEATLAAIDSGAAEVARESLKLPEASLPQQPAIQPAPVPAPAQ
ncbi:MAG: tetratricopeptide repeat protein [Asticcacaulis sp.]